MAAVGEVRVPPDVVERVFARRIVRERGPGGLDEERVYATSVAVCPDPGGDWQPVKGRVMHVPVRVWDEWATAPATGWPAGGDQVIVQHRKSAGGQLYTDTGEVVGHSITADGRSRTRIQPTYSDKLVVVRGEWAELIYSPPLWLFDAMLRFLKVSSLDAGSPANQRRYSEELRRFELQLRRYAGEWGMVFSDATGWQDVMRALGAAHAGCGVVEQGTGVR